jgi:divalent metal cation (Fe/Co/Zn/Cd) transporter
VPDESFFTLVKVAAMRVKGVLATEKVLIQTYGPDAHVSIDVEVDPAMPVEEAHAISQKVRHEIQIAWPCVRDVIVHIEPFFDGDH